MALKASGRFSVDALTAICVQPRGDFPQFGGHGFDGFVFGVATHAEADGGLSDVRREAHGEEDA